MGSEVQHGAAGECVDTAELLKQLAALQTHCQAAFDPHGGQHGWAHLVDGIVKPWHHLLKESCELITITFQTLAFLTIFAGGLASFIVAANLGCQWSYYKLAACFGTVVHKPHSVRNHTRQLNKLRQKLCGSIALGLNFLLAAEVTEQLASDHKESALEAVIEAAGFLIMVLVRGLIGYEANKESQEAAEAVESTIEVLSSMNLSSGHHLLTAEGESLLHELQHQGSGDIIRKLETASQFHSLPSLQHKPEPAGTDQHANFASVTPSPGDNLEKPGQEPLHDLMGGLGLGGGEMAGHLMDSSDTEEPENLKPAEDKKRE